MSGDYSLPTDLHKNLVPATYNPDKQELVQPISDIKLVPAPANPGGANTVWLSSVNGHLYRGPVDLEAGGPDETFDYLGTANGPFNAITPPAVELRLERFGDFVTVLVKEEVNQIASGTSLPITLTPAFPAGFRPNAKTIRATLIIRDDGAYDLGEAAITAGGNVTIRPDLSSISAFAAPVGGSAGFRQQVWTYHIV